MYLIWGTTFLAIRYGLDAFPPFLMAGVRFLIAGALFVVVTPRRQRVRLTAAQWRGTALMGLLMITIANGLVTWAEQRLSSGMTALLWATFPLWLVLFQRAGAGAEPRRQRMSPTGLVGTVLGFAGAAALLLPSSGGPALDPLGAAVVTLAVLAWTTATVVSPRVEQPGKRLYGSGLQMLVGGAVMVLLGTLGGEAARVDLARVTVPALLGFGYLVVFGSLVFPIYLWLLDRTSAAAVATEGYVCPVIALGVGVWLRGEPMTAGMVAAAAVVLAGVALMVTDQGRRQARKRTRAERCDSGAIPQLEGGMT
jgi:drug/metabolite transporter (DMT)-like permease